MCRHRGLGTRGMVQGIYGRRRFHASNDGMPVDSTWSEGWLLLLAACPKLDLAGYIGRGFWISFLTVLGVHLPQKMHFTAAKDV